MNTLVFKAVFELLLFQNGNGPNFLGSVARQEWIVKASDIRL